MAGPPSELFPAHPTTHSITPSCDEVQLSKSMQADQKGYTQSYDALHYDIEHTSQLLSIHVKNRLFLYRGSKETQVAGSPIPLISCQVMWNPMIQLSRKTQLNQSSLNRCPVYVGGLCWFLHSWVCVVPYGLINIIFSIIWRLSTPSLILAASVSFLNLWNHRWHVLTSIASSP